MNKDVIAGDWKQTKGKVKKMWAKLTDDDLLAIEGHTDALVGKLQERYGYEKERALAEVERFERESKGL